MVSTVRQKRLLHMIHLKREEMIILGLTKGLTHSSTVDCSQELDHLLNKYDEESKNPNHWTRQFMYFLVRRNIPNRLKQLG
ncbi:aspartyl-phosphate phosphatase Spo0E family protein [Mangrovibacillus cuniculi]|uniref:Aspartyl-phosphate phosphatase Spo0E family protein n=1 Tax=Mangrovibacillus cuniculi TaxID=2593652 RepID=A0A7S8C9Z6_9BACI|nr:aspartyl-phosphate phosphatase Spo0E family protein [Mangrovibacillus cuniculi]QPC46139.1 aspartyl-phosphate phosphatase Spo0E family protein [Mangrovibacillus cuniculi]